MDERSIAQSTVRCDASSAGVPTCGMQQMMETRQSEFALAGPVTSAVRGLGRPADVDLVVPTLARCAATGCDGHHADVEFCDGFRLRSAARRRGSKRPRQRALRAGNMRYRPIG